MGKKMTPKGMPFDRPQIMDLEVPSDAISIR